MRDEKIVRGLLCAALGVVLGTACATGARAQAFEPDAARWTGRLDAVLHGYHLAEWDPAELRADADAGRLTLPLPDGLTELTLKPLALHAPDMPRYVVGAKGIEPDASEAPRHYGGTVAGVPDSDVRLSLGAGLTVGYVRRGAEYLFIEPLIAYGASEVSMVVLYRGSDLKPEAAVAFDTLDGVKLAPNLARAAPETLATLSTFTPRVVELATECDGEFTQNHAGGNAGTANALIQGFVSTLDGILNSEMNIRVRLVAQFAGASPSADPFDGTVYGHGPLSLGVGSSPCTGFTGTGLWEQFKNLWNTETNRGLVRRDAAALFTGRDLKICAYGSQSTDSELYGTAGKLRTVCADPGNAYMILERYPTNSAGLLGHELGHSLGAGHDAYLNTTACQANFPDPASCACAGNGIMCGVVAPGSSTYSTNSENAVNNHFTPADTAGACVRPPVVAGPVPPGALYDFSDPTPPNVARDELLTIRNVGAAALNITNPGSIVPTAGCFQQVGLISSPIAPGGSATLRVRLLCGTRGTYTTTATIQSDDPVTPAYAFSVRGSVEPGSVADLRLTATYVPSAGAGRTAYESREAHPAQVLGYFFDPNKGTFEEQPGYTCSRGLTNPAFFKVSLRRNAPITGCAFQASWDPTELTCPQAVVDLFNQGQEIVLNTDDVLSDLSNCQLKYSAAGVLQEHVRYGQEHALRVTFLVGQGRYVRRLRFTKTSQVTYVPIPQDTYVDEADPTANFMTSTSLRLRGGEGQRRYAFLEADASAVTGSIKSATLYVDAATSFYGLYVVRQVYARGIPTGGFTWNDWSTATGGDAAFVGGTSSVAGGLVKVSLNGVTAPGAYTFRLEADDTRTTPALGSAETPYDRPWLVITTQR